MTKRDKVIKERIKVLNDDLYKKAHFEFHLFFNWVVNQATVNHDYIAFFSTSGLRGKHNVALEFYKGKTKIKVLENEVSDFIGKGKNLFMPEMKGHFVLIQTDNYGMDNIVNVSGAQAWEVKDEKVSPLSEKAWKALNEDQSRNTGKYVVPPEYGEFERTESFREVSPEVYGANMRVSSLLALLVAKLGSGRHQIINDVVNGNEVTTHSINLTHSEDGRLSVDDEFESFVSHLTDSILSGFPSPLYSVTEAEDGSLSGGMWMPRKWEFVQVEDAVVLAALSSDVAKQSGKVVEFSTHIGSIEEKSTEES